MSPESMAFKQKKRVTNTRNKYLKPGALAKICYSRTSGKSCTDNSKKRIVFESDEGKNDLSNQFEVFQSCTPVVSPVMVSSLQLALDEVKQLNLPATPKTPKSTHYDSQARLESLTMDLIVKILCHLHHDQLKAVFHVSQRIRAAVIQARQSHFNYTTPDKSRQQMLRTRTPIPAEHWPFLSIVGRRRWGSCPHTPIAQRLAPRASQFKLMEMKQIAVVLFQDSTLPPKHMVRHSLSRPVLKPLGSTRVLLYEDELCQAVSQNKLL